MAALRRAFATVPNDAQTEELYIRLEELSAQGELKIWQHKQLADMVMHSQTIVRTLSAIEDLKKKYYEAGYEMGWDRGFDEGSTWVAQQLVRQRIAKRRLKEGPTTRGKTRQLHADLATRLRGTGVDVDEAFEFAERGEGP